MSLGDEVLLDVLEVLEELGETVSFSRTTPGAYSTDTLTTGTGSTTTYSGYGVPDAYRAYEIDGTVIQKGDSILYVRTSTVPAIGDTATFDSTPYRVINVEKTRLTGVSVLYKLQVRV